MSQVSTEHTIPIDAQHLCNTCKTRNYGQLVKFAPVSTLARHAWGSDYVPACQVDGSGAVRSCSHFEGSCGSVSPSCCESCFYLSPEGLCLNAEVVNVHLPKAVPVVCEFYIERGEV